MREKINTHSHTHATIKPLRATHRKYHTLRKRIFLKVTTSTITIIMNKKLKYTDTHVQCKIQILRKKRC